MSSNFSPRSRPSFWSREQGSALPPRVGLPILHARAQSGAYSRAPLLSPAFRGGAAAACLPLPLVRTVWRVGLAEVAPSTPSSALLVDQITRAASHKCLQPLAVPYPRFTSSGLGPAPAGRQPGRRREEVTVQLCRFCDDLYRISSVSSPCGLNQRAQTFDGAQA